MCLLLTDILSSLPHDMPINPTPPVTLLSRLSSAYPTQVPPNQKLLYYPLPKSLPHKSQSPQIPPLRFQIPPSCLACSLQAVATCCFLTWSSFPSGTFSCLLTCFPLSSLPGGESPGTNLDVQPSYPNSPRWLPIPQSGNPEDDVPTAKSDQGHPSAPRCPASLSLPVL